MLSLYQNNIQLLGFNIYQREKIIGKKRLISNSKFVFLMLHVVVWILSTYYFGGFSSLHLSLTVSFRYSTISEAVSEPLVQLDFPSFIKSTIDEPEGELLSLGKCDFVFLRKIVRMKPCTEITCGICLDTNRF